MTTTALPAGCEATRYTFTVPRPPMADDPAYVMVEQAIGTGPDGQRVVRWAIRDGFGCWTRRREGFVYESMPSGRTDEFLASARWATLEEALAETAQHAVPYVMRVWAVLRERQERARRKKCKTS